MAKRRTLGLWWRTRPMLVSVWYAANPDRWAAERKTRLAERRLTEEEAGDDRVQ